MTQKNFAALLFSVLLLQGCATLGLGGDAKTDLAKAEIAYATAQEAWIGTCITPATHPAFCDDPATKSTVKHADAAATAAFQTATDAAKSASLDSATVAVLTADAIADMTAFSALVTHLKGSN